MKKIINKLDNEGFTALNYACRHENPNIEVVEYLLIERKRIRHQVDC